MKSSKPSINVEKYLAWFASFFGTHIKNRKSLFASFWVETCKWMNHYNIEKVLLQKDCHKSRNIKKLLVNEYFVLQLKYRLAFSLTNNYLCIWTKSVITVFFRFLFQMGEYGILLWKVFQSFDQFWTGLQTQTFS